MVRLGIRNDVPTSPAANKTSITFALPDLGMASCDDV
jgi:hypothetical protein